MEVIIGEMMMKVIKITITLMEVMIGEIIKVMKIMIAIMHYTVNTMIVKKMRNLVLMSINLCNI